MLKIRFRKWQVAVAAVVLLLIIVATASGGGEAVEVEIGGVTRSDIVESILCTGKIRPVMEVSISPDVSGEIVDLRVAEGSEVYRGDTLLKIRQDVYVSLVERARAALGSLEAAYIRQKASAMQSGLNLRRAEKLYAAAAISEAELENARTECAMMKGQLEAASYDVRSGRAALREAQENLTKTVITSPADGTVSRLNVSLGERVVGTSQMAGTELMRIADFRQMEVVTDVGENDVVKIHPGDDVEIDVDAWKKLVFKGTVTNVANSSKMVGAGIGQVASFEVRIAFDRDSYDSLECICPTPLRPGMTASASIATGSATGVLTVPLSSIFVREGSECLWVVGGDSKVGLRRIDTGIQDIGSIEVRSGVLEGERIVTGPHSTVVSGLSEGKTVKFRMTQ